MAIEQEYTPEFFENIIVKYLVTNSMVRDRMIPYLSGKDDTKIFHTPEIRSIVYSIIRLHEKYKEFPPASTVRMELDRTETQELFNKCILLDTSDFNETHILGKIEEFFKQGKLFNLLSDAVIKMQENEYGDMAEITDQMRDTLSFSFDQSCGLQLFEDDSSDLMYNYFHNKDNTVSSGITAFDEVTEGGFHEKSLTIFAGQSNLGKSAVLCALSSNALMDNKKVLYVTLEMNEFKIGERIIANLFDTAINDIKKISKDTFNSKYTGIVSKMKSNMVIKEFPARSMSALSLITLIKELKTKQGFEPDIVFLDYLGLMVPIKLRKDENTYSEQKRCCEEVRAAAMELALPFVSAYQVNRGAFGSTSIGMEGISDSIGVVFTVDLLTIISQSPEQKDAGIMSWTIVKSRYGLNNLRISIGIDIPKMKIYNIDNALEDLNRDIDDPERGGSSAESQFKQDNKESSVMQDFLNARKKTL